MRFFLFIVANALLPCQIIFTKFLPPINIFQNNVDNNQHSPKQHSPRYYKTLIHFPRYYKRRIAYGTSQNGNLWRNFKVKQQQFY